MASPVLVAPDHKAAIDRAAGLRYMARQPILNLRGQVHGYELLSRNGHENAFRGDLELASRTIVDNAVIFGLEDLTGGLPAFVNCTAEVLTGELPDVLPPEITVLEVLETVEPTPSLISACCRLKSKGFRIALDDFIWSPKFAPLIDLADYIKVDFILSGPRDREQLFRQLRGSHPVMLAEKVETPDEYRQAREEGFTLFQGYYFCRPVLMEKRKIPANTLSHFEILHELHRESMDLHRVADLVKRDAALTYRLMRLVNSAGFSARFSARQEIRSIDSALMVVGEDTFRRIATIAIASEMNAGNPAEIIRMALIRAQFCESAAALCSLDPTEQYLLGLLSMLPAMLQMPIDQVLPVLPLRGAIRQALEGAANPEHSLLAWLEAHERGDWPAAEAIAKSHSLDAEQLFLSYSQAVRWAETALHADA